jgi:hypothetical protein
MSDYCSAGILPASCIKIKYATAYQLLHSKLREEKKVGRIFCYSRLISTGSEVVKLT